MYIFPSRNIPTKSGNRKFFFGSKGQVMGIYISYCIICSTFSIKDDLKKLIVGVAIISKLDDILFRDAHLLIRYGQEKVLDLKN